MKKTLLCFLFLFTNLFYAQVSSIIHCAGDTTFDLTSRYDELTKDINPNQTITIKYYTKDTYAANEEYALEDPKHFVFNERSLQIHVIINTSSGTRYMNSFFIILNYPLTVAYGNITNPACGNSRLTIGAAGGRSPYQYSLDGVYYQSESEFDNVSPGSYTLYVKDNYGCIATSTKVVDPIYPLTLTALKTDNSCNGISDGRIEVIAAGGKGPYTYSIGKGFQASNIFSNLSAGTYTVTVNDATGCAYNYTLVISQPEILLSATVIKNVSSAGHDGELTAETWGGTLPYSYLLRNNVGTVLKNFQASNKFTELDAGSYNIEVRDAKGCMFLHQNMKVLAQSPLTASATYTNVTCNSAGSITINALGGASPYQYSIDNGNSYQPSNVFYNLSAGNYYVNVKDALNSVTSSTLITLTAPDPVNGVALVSAATSCTGASMLVHAMSGQSPFYYSIDNGQTFTSINTFNNLSPGNYTFFIKDSKGCVSPPLFNIVPQPSAALLATASSTPLVCAKDKTVLTINAIGGQGPYQYAINNGAFSATNTHNLGAGTYFINVKDAVGCTVSIQHSIAQPTPIYPDIVIDGQTITINGQAGTAPYQYSVDLAVYQTENVFTNLSTGNHIIHLKDAKGCESYDFTVTIGDTIPLTSAAAITKQLDCTGNAELTVTASGGQLPYQYSIDGGTTFLTIPVFTNLPAGAYIVIVKDAANVISYTNEIIIHPIVPVTATALSTPVDCVSNSIITIDAINGQAPYQYSVNNSAYSSIKTYTITSPGTYNIAVKDANSCLYTFAYTVLPRENILGALNIEGQTVTAVNVSGGSGSYLYSLDEGVFQTSPIFTNLTAGSHIIKIKDSTGCESSYTISFSIEGSNSLTSQIAITKTVDCKNNASIAIIAAGGQKPYSYSIDGGTTYQAINTFDNLTVGTYTTIVKDSTNNTKTNTFTIQYSPLTSSFTYRNVSCIGANDGSAEIIATGGTGPYLYSINNGAYTSANSFSSLAAGDYTLNVKDAAGCLTFSNIRITQPEPIVISADTINATTTNNDGKITVNATGGVAPYIYTITDNSGLPTVPFQTSNVFTGLKVGLYTIQVKDSNGCINSKINIEIAGNPNTLAVSFITTSATCLNPVGTINITATGGVSPYQYSLDGNNYAPLKTFNLVPGTYTITVRDAAGNLRPIVAEITQLSSPSVTAAVTSNILCKGNNNGIITATAIGGKAPYSYSIDGVTFSAGNRFTNLRSGTYNITVKDVNNCVSITTLTLTEPVEELSATAFPVNDQSIVVTAKGGTAPYKYFLQDKSGVVVAGPQDNGIFPRLPLGLYGAQITDANGCGYIIGGINIIPSPPLSATADVVATTCIDPGTITVQATGGFQPYYYSFDNGATFTISNVYSSFIPGNYAVKVRDYKNTIVSFTASLTQGNIPVINSTVTNVTCKGSASGSITATVSGGYAPYIYSLNNSPFISSVDKNSMTYANLLAGVHTIAVKDDKGCLITYQVVITEPTAPLISGIVVQNQTITITPSGGAGDYKFAVSPDLDNFSSNNVFSQLNPGPYTVITSDLNGCRSTVNVLVDPPSPVINGLNKFEIELKPGLTLADIVVNGQNIRWYMSLNITDGTTSKTKETPLPLSTVLVDGTTYYASQTINGIESKERLAVTVKLNGSLSTPDFVLSNLKSYPNPVLHSLTIDNTAVIDEIEIFAVSGKSILSKTINSEHSDIDLSNVSSGFYFLKVKSEGQIKIIKFVKK